MEILLHLLVSKVVSGQWSVRFYANTLYLQDDTKKIVIIYIILYIIYIIKFILTIFPLNAYCPIFNWPLTTDHHDSIKIVDNKEDSLLE